VSEREQAAELVNLRAGIGAVDEALIRLLAKRFQLVDRLSTVKRSLGAPIEDTRREKALCALYESICQREGFDAEMAKRIFNRIFAESKAHQRRAAASVEDSPRDAAGSDPALPAE
jgi:chorismate mutase